MKTHPTAQTFGCFDVELRVQWLEAKGDPLSRLDTVIDWEGFRPLLVQALAKPVEVEDSGADRTRLRLPEPVDERILPALHWAAAAQRGGVIHGATDDFGWHAVHNKVHVHDLHATMLHLMGFDHEKLTYHHGGRDYRLTDVHGRVVREILS